MSVTCKLLMRLLGGVSVAALLASAAHATPANGTFVAGGAGGSIVPSGGNVTVNTGTDPRTVITWDSFNIDNGDTVLFNQLNNQSIALNKVTGPLAQSMIDGILQSNGHVWILNPAGVAFGANANVDVGALLATTADIDTATFMATDPTTGTFTFTDAGGTGAIVVANGADLDTTGLLALVAPMVSNAGDLTSSHGDVLLGGAEAFRIKFASTPRNNGAAFNELLVTDFIIDGGSTTVAAGGDVVHQTATGRAIGGRVLANASRVGGGAFLNMEGLVEAQDVGTLSGDVMLLGGVDLTGGVLGATATDAVKTDNMTIVAPGTATAKGTAVTIGTNAGPPNTLGGASVTANVSLTATTGDITAGGDFDATTGTISMSAANGSIDTGDLQAAGDITLTGQDIDIVGTNRSINSTGGTVSLTANGGGANNVSSSGAVDIDGDSVTISGPLTGTSIDIDADNGTVTANAVAATGGAVAIDATGNIDVDNVSATTSVRVVSSAGAVDVGDVSAVTQADISGTDVDLTGTNGSVQVTTGPANLTATGGGANNISAAGAIDIDAHQVNLSGTTTATSIDIDATNGPVTGNAITATAGSVSIDASNGIDVDDVSATTTARVVSPFGAVDVGNVTGPSGVTISGTDVDLTGAGGAVQSANGITSLTATGGGVNNISAAGAIDIDGDSIQLSGPVVGGGVVGLTADVADVSSAGVLDVTGTSVTVSGPVNGAGGVALSATTGNVSVDSAVSSAGGSVALSAVNGDIDATSVSGATGASLAARDIDITGSINGGAGAAALTATAGDISTPGLLDIDGGSVSLTGAVQAGTGIDLDASTGGITATGGAFATTTGSADLRAPNGAISIGGLSAPGGISVVGASVNYIGALATQGQMFLEALVGALTGSGTSSIAAPNAGLTARALGGVATLNNVVIGGNLGVVGGSTTMTGTSMIGGTATLQALTGNVHVAGSVNATGGILLIEAPSGAAIINSIASNSDVSLVVLDLDLTGTITAGDQFNLTPAGTGRTIIIGGSGGTDGVTLRRPQGFTLDASEVTKILASKLQINAGANDLALLDATFDPASLQSLFLGADSNARIIAAGKVTGLPNLQLGFIDGATNARPDLIFVSGALGEDTATGRLGSLRLESARDIVIGTQAFLEQHLRTNGNIDLSILGEPDLALFNGTQDHVFIAADQLRLSAPREMVQLNTGTSFVGAGIVFGEAPAGEGTIVNTGGGPERVNLFGTVIRSSGERVTSFEAGLEPNLLGPGLSQNGELRLNLCVIGNSSSCSIAILREAQESARSRNSALSSLTNNTLFGFEDDDDDDEDEDDLGGVAGAGNEGLWGVGLP